MLCRDFTVYARACLCVCLPVCMYWSPMRMISIPCQLVCLCVCTYEFVYIDVCVCACVYTPYKVPVSRQIRIHFEYVKVLSVHLSAMCVCCFRHQSLSSSSCIFYFVMWYTFFPGRWFNRWLFQRKSLTLSLSLCVRFYLSWPCSFHFELDSNWLKQTDKQTAIHTYARTQPSTHIYVMTITILMTLTIDSRITTL